MESLTSRVRVEEILKHKKLEWKYSQLYHNPNIGHIDARVLGVKTLYTEDILIYNTIIYVRQCPNLLWDKNIVSGFKDITINDVLHLNLPNSVGKWNYNKLSSCIHMDDNIIHSHLPWNKHHMSFNETIRIDHLKTRKRFNIGKWKWNALSQRIPLKDIVKHKYYPWNDNVGYNPTITLAYMDMLKFDPYKNISYFFVTNLPLEECLSFKDIVNPLSILFHKDMTYKIAYKNGLCNDNIYTLFSYLPIKEMISYRTFIKHSVYKYQLDSIIQRFTSIYDYFEFMDIKDPRIYFSSYETNSKSDYTDLIIIVS